MYTLAGDAYPSNDTASNQLMQDMLVNQFITGIHAPQLRMNVLQIQYRNLDDLRERAVEQEAVMLAGLG